MHRCSEHGLSDRVLPNISSSRIPCNREYMGWPEYASGTFVQVDNDVFYRWIANQPSPAYSSLYLSNFLSFHTLNDEFFRQKFR